MLLLALVLQMTTALQAQSSHNAGFHIGLLYPISSNGRLATEYTNHCSFHAIAGVSGNEDGITFSGFANIIRHDARGAQFAGFSNHVQGEAKGAQFAGFLNDIRYQATGVQAAGFANITGSSRGLQLAGFANISRKQAYVQAGGFINLTSVARVQLAGFMNQARDVQGAQVAGFINVAKKVTGVQVAGFINIADSSEYPIGLINIVRNGERSLGLTMDETLTSLVTFRSGGKHLYGILGAGMNVKQAKVLQAVEGGLGLHVPVSGHFRINMEGTMLILTDFTVGHYFRSSYRILPSVRAGRFELFAGPTFNCVTLSHAKGVNLVSNYAYERKRFRNFTGLYFGGMAGIQFLL